MVHFIGVFFFAPIFFVLAPFYPPFCSSATVTSGCTPHRMMAYQRPHKTHTHTTTTRSHTTTTRSCTRYTKGTEEGTITHTDWSTYAQQATAGRGQGCIVSKFPKSRHARLGCAAGIRHIDPTSVSAAGTQSGHCHALAKSPRPLTKRAHVLNAALRCAATKTLRARACHKLRPGKSACACHTALRCAPA